MNAATYTVAKFGDLWSAQAALRNISSATSECLTDLGCGELEILCDQDSTVEELRATGEEFEVVSRNLLGVPHSWVWEPDKLRYSRILEMAEIFGEDFGNFLLGEVAEFVARGSDDVLRIHKLKGHKLEVVWPPGPQVGGGPASRP